MSSSELSTQMNAIRGAGTAFCLDLHWASWYYYIIISRYYHSSRSVHLIMSLSLRELLRIQPKIVKYAKFDHQYTGCDMEWVMFSLLIVMEPPIEIKHSCLLEDKFESRIHACLKINFNLPCMISSFNDSIMEEVST